MNKNKAMYLRLRFYKGISRRQMKGFRIRMGRALVKELDKRMVEAFITGK